MKPSSESQQYCGGDKCSPIPRPGQAEQLQGESVVVVLGVMYPGVLPQRAVASTHLDLVLLPSCLTTGRQSMDVVFYDPLSSTRNGDEALLVPKYRKKPEGSGLLNRAEAHKAVTHDLALLSLRKRE